LLAGEELSVTDLAKRAGLAYPTAHREVALLMNAGILSERQVGRTRLIRANGKSPLVDPLREILMVATGPVVILAEELARGEARQNSDTDLRVDTPPTASSFEFIKFKRLIEQVLGRELDLISYGGLKPKPDDDIRREAVLL
jgi:DNA-binding transcriptional ArsR family regulator